MNTPETAVVENVIKPPKKDTWINSVFRWFSYVFVFWMGILAVYIIFSVYATWMFNSKKKNEQDSLDANDLKKPALDAVVFSEDDVSSFTPTPGQVTDVQSDRTTYDLLQGKYGAVIVLLYADWCVHCKNMIKAFEDAAAVSSVPFVKVEGQYPRQTMKHFKANGFPTIYGVNTEGRVFPFVTFRTKDEFLKFAEKLKPTAPQVVQATVEVEVLDADVPVKDVISPESLDSQDAAPLASDSA